MKQTLEVSPELRVQLDLEAHEKECAVRYKAVEEKLNVSRQTTVETRSTDHGFDRHPSLVSHHHF